MKSINKVLLIGNIANDPHYLETEKGKRLIFTLVTNRNWITNGEKRSQAEFHTIVTFNQSADFFKPYLTKGKYIYVEGYLQTRIIKEGETKITKTEIVTNDIIFLEKREKNFEEEEFENNNEENEDNNKFFDNLETI